MYRYKIKKGAEDRVFSAEGMYRDPQDSSVLISDHELNSPHLEAISSSDKVEQQPQPPAPIQPPQNPVLPVQPPVQPAPANNQVQNNESEN